MSPIQLRQKHLRLTIEIPDEDVVAPSIVSEALKYLHLVFFALTSFFCGG